MKLRQGPNPPEFRLQALCLEYLDISPVEFIALCTESRHRDKGAKSPLVETLEQELGLEWALELFKYSIPEFRVTVIEENPDEHIRNLFAQHRLSRAKIIELAEEFCDRVAAYFGLPVPLSDQPGESTV